MNERLPIGINQIDKYVSLKRGEVVVIAGRLESGKTTMACKMIHNLAIKQSYKIGVISFEEHANDYARRILLKRDDRRTGINYLSELSNASNGVVKIADSELLLFTVDEVAKLFREWKKQMGGLDYVFIDNIHLFVSTIHLLTHEQYVEFLADVSCSLKALAKELNCVVVLQEQLLRRVDVMRWRPNHSHRPISQDISDLGIEQNVDVELLLYKESYYYPNSNNENKLEVIIGKNGNDHKYKSAFLDFEKDLL